MGNLILLALMVSVLILSVYMLKNSGVSKKEYEEMVNDPNCQL